MLLSQMDLNGVDKAVLIQHRGNYDNRYLLECMQRFPGRFAAVVGVDPSQPDATATLEGLAQESGVVGLRLRPNDRSPGGDPLSIWRKAGELGLVISCFSVDVDHVAAPEFRRLVEELPNCTIVLEHLAGVHRHISPDSVTPPYTAYRTALELARFPNAYIKFGGLGEFCIRPPRLQPQFGFDEVLPMLEMAREAFGPRRMMWAATSRLLVAERGTERSPGAYEPQRLWWPDGQGVGVWQDRPFRLEARRRVIPEESKAYSMAFRPVISRPRTRVWISYVPS